MGKQFDALLIDTAAPAAYPVFDTFEMDTVDVSWELWFVVIIIISISCCVWTNCGLFDGDVTEGETALNRMHLSLHMCRLCVIFQLVISQIGTGMLWETADVSMSVTKKPLIVIKEDEYH